jgi:hypothetical protein
MTRQALAGAPGLCHPAFAICRAALRQRNIGLNRRGSYMLKAVGWIVLIIFIIGLLVVLGVFKAIF